MRFDLRIARYIRSHTYQSQGLCVVRQQHICTSHKTGRIALHCFHFEWKLTVPFKIMFSPWRDCVQRTTIRTRSTPHELKSSAFVFACVVCSSPHHSHAHATEKSFSTTGKKRRVRDSLDLCECVRQCVRSWFCTRTECSNGACHSVHCTIERWGYLSSLNGFDTEFQLFESNVTPKRKIFSLYRRKLNWNVENVKNGFYW